MVAVRLGKANQKEQARKVSGIPDTQTTTTEPRSVRPRPGLQLFIGCKYAIRLNLTLSSSAIPTPSSMHAASGDAHFRFGRHGIAHAKAGND